MKTDPLSGTASPEARRPREARCPPATPASRGSALTESEIQKAVFDNLRKRAMPSAVFWHTPNDKSSRNKVGYRAGVSDVSIVYRKSFYALELKRDGGRASEEQLKFVSEINAAGGYAVVAEGLSEALECLECWGILRKAA